MPVLHQLQPSFNNGEISPLLYDRVDFQKFVSSVKSGKNMFVHPQGGMSNRAGTVMLAQAKDEKVRLIPFEFSSTETYVIEFGNGYCRFFTAEGQVVVEEGGVQVPYEIESPFTTADLDKIRYCQSGDVMYIAWGGKPKTLTRYGHTDWSFADYNYKSGPLKVSTEDISMTIGKTTATESVNYVAEVVPESNVYKILGTDALTGNYHELSSSNSPISVCNGYLFRFQYNSAAGAYNLSYSVNGSSWTTLFIDVLVDRTNVGPAVVYYNGVYLFGAATSTGHKLYKFTDFSTITEIIIPGISYYNFTKLYVCDNKFFTIASFSDNPYYEFIYSSDGSSWQQSGMYCGYETQLCFLNSKYYLNSSGSSALNVYDSSFNSVGSYSVPSEYSKIGVANSKLWSVDWNRGGSPSYSETSRLFYFDENANSFVLHTSVVAPFGKGNSKIHNATSTTFFDLGENLYKLESDNSLTQINNYFGTYRFNNIFDFVVSASESRYVLSSTEYSFSQEDIGRTFVLNTDLDASILSGATLSGSSGSSSILCKGSWRFDISGTWGGNVSISYSKDNVHWNIYRKYDSNVSASGSFDELVFVKVVWSISSGSFSYSFATSLSKIDLSCVGQYVVDANNLYVTPEEDSFLLWDYVLNKTGVVSFGLWSAFDYWPTEVDLYQDRIVWITNNQLDATKISDYTNFGVSTDVTEDDAISVIIKDKKIDKINSIVAGQKLAVYSDDGNFVHNNDTFTPQSATFLKQGATGGSDVKPVVVRDHIIYAHPMKQAISDYAYNFETDGYAGQDISILANHLFDGKVIKTLAYQQEPYSIIWVLQEEGTVLACTYLRQQNVIAWTPMDFGGKVLSIAVCSTGTEEHLYLAVERENGTFVEKMPTRLLSAAPEECFFVDCGRTYRGEPATIISGLDYLEGQNVVALADGNVIKDLTVEDGSITLPIPASVVTVGLPYESVLETLTFDANTGDGSNLNRKKRVVAVSIRYNASRGSKLSVNGHAEVDMLRREQEGYNIPIALKSGVYREIVASTHDEKTAIKIRQDEPLPITIVSITPEIEYER